MSDVANAAPAGAITGPMDVPGLDFYISPGGTYPRDTYIEWMRNATWETEFEKEGGVKEKKTHTGVEVKFFGIEKTRNWKVSRYTDKKTNEPRDLNRNTGVGAFFDFLHRLRVKDHKGIDVTGSVNLGRFVGSHFPMRVTWVELGEKEYARNELMPIALLDDWETKNPISELVEGQGYKVAVFSDAAAAPGTTGTTTPVTAPVDNAAELLALIKTGNFPNGTFTETAFINHMLNAKNYAGVELWNKGKQGLIDKGLMTKNGPNFVVIQK